MAKIITPGKPQAAAKVYKTKCGSCGCEFEYSEQEIKCIDFLVSILQVKCPQEGCLNQVIHWERNRVLAPTVEVINGVWMEQNGEKQRVVVRLELPCRVEVQETLTEISTVVLRSAQAALHDICTLRGLYSLVGK